MHLGILKVEYPQIYKHSQEGKCVVKTNTGYFKSVAFHIKLQKSKEHLIFRKEKYTRMFLARRWNFSQT